MDRSIVLVSQIYDIHCVAKYKLSGWVAGRYKGAYRILGVRKGRRLYKLKIRSIVDGKEETITTYRHILSNSPIHRKHAG